MEGKGNISDYRRKLDKTLASPDLSNDEILQTLVKKQILQSDLQLEGGTENVVERRTKELSNTLSMLRSASANDVDGSKSGQLSPGAWKLKQDTEEFRVMYREGLEGTPFHTLLVEGYIDGPLDVCLCVSWESGLYQKWWPQSAIPSFKVASSRCIKVIRTGEQISLLRMKVSWPLSSREALTHYFAFEYFQDDLVVVLLNTISDSENIDRSSHGFTRDGIPDAEDVVRIDVVGGFAIQKVSADRSYFRTIANMDIKLDFVPPAFINFVSRQLIGSGFKLYKKEVASVSKGDKEFKEALKDPLYTRIREALYTENSQKSTSLVLEDERKEAVEIIDTEAKEEMVRDRNEPNEIEEIQEKGAKESVSLDNSIMENFRDDQKEEYDISTEGNEAPRPTNGNTEKYRSEIRNKGVISSDVEQALKTLDRVISVFRGHNCNFEKGSNINSASLHKEAVEESMSSEAYQNYDPSKLCSQESNSHDHGDLASRHKGLNSHTKETNQSKIVPDDQEQPTSPSNSNHIALHSSINHKILEKNYFPIPDDNNPNGNGATKTKNKRSRFCCLRASVN